MARTVCLCVVVVGFTTLRPDHQFITWHLNPQTATLREREPKMRKGCRTSKTEKACPNYSYSLGRCLLGKVKATCSLVRQPKAGTKASFEADFVRAFYAG